MQTGPSVLVGAAAAAVALVAGVPAGGADRAPGTERMAARLDRLVPRGNPGRNPTVGCDFRVAWFKGQRDRAGDRRARLNLSLELGFEQLKCGATADAIEEFLQVRRAIERDPAVRDDVQSNRFVAEWLAMSYLRLGEEQNCLAQHGPDSCLLPIRGSGVHSAREGSELAIGELGRLLGLDPDDLAARWLLNLAYMTLGEYPEQVPPAWLIPPAVFESEYDVGRFANVASDLGVAVLGLSGGAVSEDLDGDGFVDILASGWGAREQVRLFRNGGDGTFSDRTVEAGLIGETGGLNMCHADYDNDGDADVLILRGAWAQEDGRIPNSLLRNEGDCTFADVTEEAGILSFRPTQTAGWADYDGDGDLDLFIGNESTEGQRHPCELYRNDGDGTFTDVAVLTGVAHVGFVKGVAWGDYDNDGRPDLYLSRQGEPNVLYRNAGPTEAGWAFTDVTERAGVAEPLRSFPTWFWDYDNDGWLDLFVAPFPGFTANTLDQIAADYLGRPCTAERARLYRNNGDGSFTDVAEAAGLGHAMLAMGSNYGDIDNDGWLDAYIGTGEPNLRSLVPNRMYRNAGGRFQNVTFSGGFGHLQKGHGIAFADFDNDGDQDIYAVMGGAYTSDVAYNALFLNPGHGNHWITLRLEGTRANRAGIGARIVVEVDAENGPRRIHVLAGTGGSFGSSSLQQEIGLGRAKSIRSIEITWPGSGTVQRFEDVPPDRIYRAREGDDRLHEVQARRVKLGEATERRSDGATEGGTVAPE